jgi:hypothetical protein
MNVRLLALPILVLSILVFSPPPSEARSDTRVKGYVKKGGKAVSPYKRKSPNKSKLDNYGTKGNVNPNTHKVGKEDPFAGKEKR